MSTHLDRILAETRRTVEQRRDTVPVRQLEELAARHTPRGFATALRKRAQSGPAILAELKKASPSKGLIRADFQVEQLARELEQAGAAALSVLTDEPFFQGSLQNLERASQAVALPCLRKDFIVDEYQLLEARAHRADAILLIAAALHDDELRKLNKAAHALNLDVLCEVHNREELDRVLELGADAIGVNNRNLKTFEVRLETSIELAELLPESAVHVAESGLAKAADLEQLRAVGFHAFLIGESLMRAASPGHALAQMLGNPTTAERS